nr:YqaJ viral recombinase family protein [Clostridium chromiireducens]
MRSIEFHKERQKGIGGSDVGAIMGVNRHKSIFEIFAEKISDDILEEISLKPSYKNIAESAYWGETLKEVNAKEYTVRTGKKVRKENKILIDSEYDFMRANIDRKVIGENSILMCKTSSVFSAKEYEGEEIPANFILQCQHNMRVSGADKCYIASLIGGQRFVIKEIERDDELINMIIEKEKDFWYNHVLKRIPPLIDGSLSAAKYIDGKYKNSEKGLEVTLHEDYTNMLTEYTKIKDSIQNLDQQLKQIENNIKNEMKSAEIGILEKYRVDWKRISSNRIDAKTLKNNYPEVYKNVIKEIISRRFEVKEI